jgi:hypothetical protein
VLKCADHTSARRVDPELLDDLPPADPRARRSRADLRRVNWAMASARTVAGIWKGLPSRRSASCSVVDLGGGDGTFLLAVARRLGPLESRTAVQIVDRQDLLTADTAAQFASLGWRVRGVPCEVFEWLERPAHYGLIVANLFLHHFADAELARLLHLIAARTSAFVACEPRRFRFPRLAGGLVSLIGCNSITRHDAIVSVRAGFRGKELSALWTREPGWGLAETKANLFSHAFVACRPPAAGSG